jgi:hypothetical protein
MRASSISSMKPLVGVDVARDDLEEVVEPAAQRPAGHDLVIALHRRLEGRKLAAVWSAVRRPDMGGDGGVLRAGAGQVADGDVGFAAAGLRRG